MRRKKHSDRGGGGGGGGTELFICFTSRPSTASSGLRPSASSKAFSPGRGGGGETAPPALRPSLSRRLRNSGSLKGGQSPMFPPGTTVPSGGRRGRAAGMEPAEPSSPKVTCIGQVRVKGGKRKPKHASAAAALRSRSRRGVGGGGLGSESSFRRGGVDDRDGPGGKNPSQGGWVYQIPVNICEALKTFGSCGGRSLCSPSRDRPRSAAADKKRRRAPPGGSWLCGAAMARCLLAIQEEEEDVGKGSAVGPADDARGSEVGLVMQGWDVEDDEEEEFVVGEVEVDKEDEILLVGAKEEEGRVSVCIPPRNALLLMRCRSDPVRMAALATRFWGSPAAANVNQVVVDNEGDNGDHKQEEEQDHRNVDNECQEEEEEAARNSTVSVDDAVCRDCGVVEDGGAEAGDAGQANTEAEESSEHADLEKEENDSPGNGEQNDDKPAVEVQIVRKDVGLEVASAGEAANKSESQAPGMVEVAADAKEVADVPRQDKEEEEVKGRRSVSSCSPSTALKEDRKLRRLGSKKRVSSSSRASSSSDRVDRRHSFSAEMEARRSSFSSVKDSRRASFSIDRDGRRWSFTIEQEHLVAEPKVLMASRKGKKNSSEPESEKDCAVLVVAPNSVEEAQESHDDGKEEAAKDGEEEGTTQGIDVSTEVEKVETIVDEKEAVEVKQDRRKKSGELPDCLLMMMCEPKLSMEVSKETWVCSTDFVHWKSHQGQNRCQQKAAATGSNAAASKENKDADNAEETSIVKGTEESKAPAPLRSASMPPQVVVQKPPPKPATEKKLKLEPPMVASVAAAYAPLVLKRCKSEPLRSSARLAPDACFWKDRHRPLNATGIGF